MKTGKYSIKELFVNRYVQQIVIPEIQRDYVWQHNQVKGLLQSIIVDYDEFKQATIPKIDTDDSEIKKTFEDFYKKRHYSSNIGFIYAYNDEQYTGKYFLIDGQQRITTIYIMLLALGCKNENLKNKFISTYLIDDILKLDYKVRESTHNFANEFVKQMLIGVIDVKNQNWYFNKQYDTDISIQSWISNFRIISNYFEHYSDDYLIDFYSYIENQVEFWYFDTNISEQGEELYIYMNARGAQMQNNENLKADLLSKYQDISKKNAYGKLWEDWQDYFWLNKSNNENADKGFNDFLFCIAGLERYIDDDISNFYLKEIFENQGVQINDIIEKIDITKIEKYISCIKYISEKKTQLNKTHNYTDWIDELNSQVWKIFNSNDTNWFADYTDANRAVERNKMVLVWSILHYLSEKDLCNEDPIEIYRFLRKIYLRFNNFNRSVTSIKAHVSIAKTNGVIDTLDNFTGESEDVEVKIDFSEERLKNQLLMNCQEVYKIESLIWQLEDHKFNLNGKDVGNLNIGHIVNFNIEITVDYLEKLLSKFNQIFPAYESEYKKIQQVLLHYGSYWEEVSPYYYQNLKFDNWRKIIRGKDCHLHYDFTPFQKFLYEFLQFDGSLDEFINQKNINNPLIKDDIIEDHQIFLWYNLKLGEEMWQQGNYLAISRGNYCGIPDCQKKDANFSKSYAIYNSKGSLRTTPNELSTLIKVQ